MKFDNKDSMGRDHQFKEDWLFVTLVSSKGAQVKFQPYFKFNKKSINFIKTMVENIFSVQLFEYTSFKHKFHSKIEKFSK